MKECPDPAEPPPHVLIAEDDDTLRALIARAVCEMGWEVSEARDGQELIQLLDAERESAVPTLLVTDIHMPRLDGIDLLVELSSRRCRLPTIVVTAFAEEPTRQMVRALGASMIFSKPFDVDDLCTALQYLNQTPRH